MKNYREVLVNGVVHYWDEENNCPFGKSKEEYDSWMVQLAERDQEIDRQFAYIETLSEPQRSILHDKLIHSWDGAQGNS